MSRVYKKVLGLLGLALVAGITTVAVALPPADISAVSSDVRVSFTIANASPVLTLTGPADASLHYDDNIITISVDHKNVKSAMIVVTDPNDISTPFNYTLSNDGTILLPFSASDYGDYTITLSGTDINDDSIAPTTSTFTFHAITVSDNGNGNIHVNYGPATCGLSFQLYDVNDATLNSPLLDPPYVVDSLNLLPGHPDFADIEIPGFEQLGDSTFNVVVTALACSDDKALEDADTVTEGIVQPPKTGVLNILGVTITNVDYLVAGLISFTLIALFALFLIRHKKAQRK